MNNNTDFQDWMKEKVAQQQFEPPQDGWQKLQSALQATPEKSKSKRLYLIWPMAAAVMLVFGLAWTYYSSKQSESLVPHSIVLSDKAKSNTNDLEQQSINPKDTAVIDNHLIAKPNITNTFNKHPNSTFVKYTKQKDASANQPVIVIQKPVQELSQDALTNDTTIAFTNPKQTVTVRNISDYVEQSNPVITIRQPIEIGIAANSGNNNIGTAQYQIAINAREHLNQHIFVDAAFAISATAVAFNNQYSFDGIILSPNDGLGNSVGSYEPTESQTPINTEYKQNVYAVGLSSKLGFKLNKQFSFLVGGFVNRNINTNVGLNNMDAVSMLNVSVPVSQSVNEWTMGVTGGIEYRMMHRIAAYAGYRQGLNNYVYFLNRYHKISGIELGLKIKLNQ